MTRLPSNRVLRAAARKTKAEVKSKLAAEEEWTGTLQGRKKWFRDAVRKLISDLGEKIDPLELMAILGLTWTVKQIMDIKFPDFRSSIFVSGAAVPTWGIEGGLRGLRDELAAGITGTETGIEWKQLLAFPDWQEWIVAFVIAFIVIRHGDALLASIGSLVKVVGLLLPM